MCKLRECLEASGERSQGLGGVETPLVGEDR